jgi:hypothetical protein
MKREETQPRTGGQNRIIRNYVIAAAIVVVGGAAYFCNRAYQNARDEELRRQPENVNFISTGPAG